MGTRTWRAGCGCLLLLALAGSFRSEDLRSCEQVGKLFQGRLVGAVRGLPESPRAGPDLQVCTSQKPTCCTRKMEERFQVAARQDMQQVLQTSSSTLKFLISRNAAAFQVATVIFFSQLPAKPSTRSLSNSSLEVTKNAHYYRTLPSLLDEAEIDGSIVAQLGKKSSKIEWEKEDGKVIDYMLPYSQEKFRCC